MATANATHQHTLDELEDVFGERGHPAASPRPISHTRKLALATEPAEDKAAKALAALVEQRRSDPRRRRISARVGFETDTPPKEKIIPSICRGVVAMLNAAGGTGKGWLSLELAILLASGADPLGITEGRPDWAELPTGPVLFVSLEDDEQEIMIRQRTIAKETGLLDGKTDAEKETILAAIDRNLRLEFYTGAGISDLLDDPGWVGFLREEAASHRLIIIDTLRRATETDENEGPDMVRLLTRLETIADRRATVLLIHHTSKEATLNGRGDSQMAGRGSTVLPYNTRGSIFLQTMTEAEATEHWKTFEADLKTFDRHRYVRFGISKPNHGPKWPDIWLRRTDGGALVVAKPLRQRANEAMVRAGDRGKKPVIYKGREIPR